MVVKECNWLGDPIKWNLQRAKEHLEGAKKLLASKELCSRDLERYEWCDLSDDITDALSDITDIIADLY